MMILSKFADFFERSDLSCRACPCLVMAVRIVFQNVNSLRTKCKDFLSGILNHHANIVCVTEINLLPSINDAKRIPPGYVVFRRDRIHASKRNGGGVLMAANVSLPITHKIDWSCDGVEALWMRIKCSGYGDQGVYLCCQGVYVFHLVMIVPLY
ncbi:hypothetical protein QE152_g15597 [Popillia japonica]|uniref:Uncharacterized protein n=1 Tax=Popillia japonica TaxID=7064 RepID=A0AAW1L7E6_POPJA